MHQVLQSLEALGGIASLRELRCAGHGESAIRLACARGIIRRLRRGWYASASADSSLAAAVTIGGRLGCVSALAEAGIWQPPYAGVHVALARGANHLATLPLEEQRALGGIHLHWMAKRSVELTTAQPLLEALAAAFRCQPEEYAFAMLESAIRLGRLDGSWRSKLKRRVAERFWSTIDFADGIAESGSESVFKFLARRDGLVVRQQVEFLGIIRVDFALGNRHAIEIDSATHHGSPQQRLRDLRRDAWLASLGGSTLRFDYRMVLEDWDLVRAALEGALRSEQSHGSPTHELR